jgi:hypothetical protein
MFVIFMYPKKYKVFEIDILYVCGINPWQHPVTFNLQIWFSIFKNNDAVNQKKSLHS